MAWHVIKNFCKQLLFTTKRFPLVILFVSIACSLFLYQNHFTNSPNLLSLKSNLIGLCIECVAGIPLFFAFHIYAENKVIDRYKQIGFFALALCLLGLHFYTIPNDVYNFALNYTLRYFLIILCFHLIVSFSLYNEQTEIDAFWLYNEFLFVRIFTTLLFTLIFFAGIAGAIWAVDVLFGINIDSKYYFDVLGIMFFIFNTYFFLNTIPQDTHYFEREKTYQPALKVFVKNILIPIVIIYGVVLFLYLGKILLSHSLPKGWVAIPILIFSGLGILAYLLSYPIRAEKKDVIFYFCQYFFYILLPFLSLYFSSIVKRINHYGLTEERYIGLALGIWLAFIAIYKLTSKKDYIIFIPVSLCILLVLCSFGPWGMYKLSATNQFNRLKVLLTQNDLIKSGKIISTPKKLKNKKDAKQINSIISYLFTHNAIDKIKPLLHDNEIKKLDQFIKEGYDEKNVGVLLGVETENGITTFEEKNYFTCNSNTIGMNSLPIETKGHYKILEINAIDFWESNVDFELANDSSQFVSFLKNNYLFILHQTDTVLKMELKNYTSQMKKQVLQSIGDSTFFNKTISNITLPYRQQYYSREKMMYQTEEAVLYVQELKCIQTKTQTKAIGISGYAIF